MSNDLTQWTGNLTPLTAEALAAAVEQTGLSRTDTINRAVQMYAQLIQAHDEGNGWAVMVWNDAPAKKCVIEVNRPWWRFW